MTDKPNTHIVLTIQQFISLKLLLYIVLLAITLCFHFFSCRNYSWTSISHLYVIHFQLPLKMGKYSCPVFYRLPYLNLRTLYNMPLPSFCVMLSHPLLEYHFSSLWTHLYILSVCFTYIRNLLTH